MTKHLRRDARGVPIYYADNPARRIPGTDVTAVTVYRSTDGTVRHYALYHPTLGDLGNVAYHGRSLAVSAGYHRGHGVYDPRKHNDWWPSLGYAADTLAREAEEKAR